MNRTPAYGCSSIGSCVWTSNLPISPVQQWYSLELEVTTKQYSLSGWQYIGCLNSNVVTVCPLELMFTSSGFLVDSEPGNILCVGYPFSISLISTVTGKPVESLVEK